MPHIASFAELLAAFGTDVPTIADAVAWRARACPETSAFRFLRLAGPPDEVSFAALHGRVVTWAAAIAERTSAGDRVMLLFQPGLEFVAAFLACQRAGTVPVPMALPRAREPQSRLAAVIENCRPTLILSHADARAAIEDAVRGVSVLETEQIPADAAHANPTRRTGLAFLQYTSGSTGQPKGVMVTHRNVLANVQDIAHLFEVELTPAVRSVSWLPTYHDMGLIGCVLAPMLVAADSTLMAPAAFLRDPLSWLQAIAARRAEISGGPNFAFELCARRLLDERSRPDPKELDLSCWRVAFTGAEPVRASMLMRFAAAAAPYGFRPEAFLPCYGLAEATLCVCGIRGSPGRLVEHFDPEALGQGRALALPRVQGQAGARRAPLVTCGDLTASAATVAIVGPEDRTELPGGSVGEIWISGAAIAAGYWDERADSSGVFGQVLAGRSGAFLRTGDLGFIHEAKLFITGRLRDLIIINGVNYHPEDIEHTIGARLPELASGRAVFAIESEDGVRIVVLQELARVQWRSVDAGGLSAAICSAVWDGHAIAVQDVVLLAPGALPMTSSGKVQRQRCRELYLAGRIEGRRSPPAPESPAPALESGPANDALKLRAILAEVLGVRAEEVRVDRPIASFGLDSLKTTQMKLLVESRMAWEVPGEALHGEMTLLDIADRRGMPEAPEAGTFWTDGALPAALLPPAARPSLDGDILVTGATGLVGSHMVRELVRRQDGVIFCLVRADSDASAHTRLAEHLAAVGLSAADLERRVRAVRGDAALPNLGLTHGKLMELAGRVGVVFHNAARLDFLGSYGELRSANVRSVRSILEFAVLGRPKFLGHTSSVSVLESPLRREGRVAEHAPLDFPESLAVGYAQSKWVADSLVLHARARGFAASIFRPSWIVGPIGSTPSADFLVRFLEGCRRLGALPESAYRWDLVPAKHVARAIVELTWADAGRQPVYHLGAVRQLSGPQLAAGLQRLGMALDVVSVDEWLTRLRAALAADPAHPLTAVAGLFLNDNGRPPAAESYLRGQTPAMDSRRTWTRLRELGIAELPAADELLAALVSAGALRPAAIPAAVD